jgi:hypothetical protein
MLQSCANVKSAEERLGNRDHKRQGLVLPNNIFIFNILRGGDFQLLRQVRSNAQPNRNEEVTVSTTFSTEDGATDAPSEGPLSALQVSRNTRFP